MKIRFVTLSLLALFGAEAFANNAFIPNYYRNRRALNEYSAVGWTDRKEVGARYDVTSLDEKAGGTKTSENKNTQISPYLYYRTPYNLNFEAALMMNDAEEKSVPAGTKVDKEGVDYQVGVGYELTGAPVAFGLVVKGDNDETTNAGTKTKDETTSVSLGVGYRLEGDYYLGVGYENSSNKVTGAKTDVDHEYRLGVGKVYGDRANPTAATEAVLSFENEDNTQTYGLNLQGLVNAENLQYYGSVLFGTSSGKRDVTSYGLVAGLDYKFMDFYVGPQLSWIMIESKVTGAKQEISALIPSLEAGYRLDFFEAFLRYDMNSAEDKTTVAGTPATTKYEGNTLTANLAYKF